MMDLESEAIAVVFGTRPEIIKLAEVIRLLGDAALLVHTGQHFDRDLDSMIVAELGFPPAKVRFEVGGRGRGGQIGEATRLLDEHFSVARPRGVIVQGDTNSTVAAALAANARQLPLIHVEAGLRCYDRTLPEEHNRVVTDHLADLCCAPTPTSAANLAAEGICGHRVVICGNTIVESVRSMLPDVAARRSLVETRELCPGSFAVATFHRGSNVDDREVLEAILTELADLPLPVLLPIHPRTADRAAHFGLSHLLDKLWTSPPLSHRDFLALVAECAFIVTDSGGIQEEASVLKRPVIVVRTSTERPEVLGTFATLVSPGPAIGEVARSWCKDPPALHRRLATIPSPYGDGSASQRIVAATIALLTRNGGSI